MAPGDITLKQQYSGYWGWAADLELSIAGSSDKITIGGGVREMSTGSSDYSTVQKIEFADGTVWDTNALKALLFAGTAGADTINGTDLADTIHGGAGADTLSGRGGDDTLDGGSGNDALNGEAGNDSYLFARGSGQDTVSDYDTTVGNTDIALFGADIAADQLWFRQAGNHLEVSVIGGTDRFTVSNWYSGSSYHVEQFKAADGKVLLDTQVQNLVQAMAGFAPPAAGQTTLPASYQSSLNPVIAANWH